jgi:hypothetical protein
VVALLAVLLWRSSKNHAWRKQYHASSSDLVRADDGYQPSDAEYNGSGGFS